MRPQGTAPRPMSAHRVLTRPSTRQEEKPKNLAVSNLQAKAHSILSLGLQKEVNEPAVTYDKKLNMQAALKLQELLAYDDYNGQFRLKQKKPSDATTRTSQLDLGRFTSHVSKRSENTRRRNEIKKR